MWPFVIVTILALAVVLYTERRGESTFVGALAKVVASGAFLGAAIVCGALDNFYGQTLMLALGWSFVGDVLLLAPATANLFMFGVGAFLFAHLGYVMVFRLRGVDATAVWIALAVLAAIGLGVFRWLSPHVRGGMRIAIGLYIAVISLMVAFALGDTAAGHGPLPLIGAVLFWLSDLFVARQRFVARSFWNRALGLPLYYAAQYVLIALL